LPEVQGKRQSEGMKDDFDIIVHKFPRDNIRLYGIADLHLAAKECMEKEFIAFRDMILADDHAYVAVGGDLRGGGILHEYVLTERHYIIAVSAADDSRRERVGHEFIDFVEPLVYVVFIGIV
jgi:hypothetical protein